MNQKHAMDSDVNKIARKVVLVVCMLDSIHSARWLSLFKDHEIDFLLFPSTPNRRLHAKIKSLIDGEFNQDATFKISRVNLYGAIPIWLAGRFTNSFIPALFVKLIAKKNSIDLIHAIELNHAGYLVASAKKLGLPKSIKIIATNWGSDIYWFQQFPRHRKKIKEIMRISDFYSAECIRDLSLASKFGFRGEFKEVLPNAGGFEIEKMFNSDSKPPSERNGIVVKGYESFVGRVSIILKAFSMNPELLKDYEIYIYSANNKTMRLAKRLAKSTGLRIYTYRKKSLGHEDVLDLFQKSRVYIGVSLSDGISTSLLEAIVSGAFPIQTDTSCANEWITDGKSGIIIPPNAESVLESLTLALKDDELVNKAAILNLHTARQRLDNSAIKAKVSGFYR
jgi:glycosyltransferase involved in cell wall biosynthesis